MAGTIRRAGGPAGARGRAALRASAALLGVLSSACLVTPVAGAPGDVREDRLPNGLTVLTMPNAWNRIVAVSILVDAGSKYDPAGTKGLAKITNDLLVRGTSNMAEQGIAEIIDASGIQLGTSTTEDFAEVHVTAIDSQWQLALRILADVLTNPSFDTKGFLDVQRRALAALSGDAEDALRRSNARANELLFGEHPYAFPVIGTAAGIERVTRGDVARFYAGRYRASDTVIAIVGNFARDDALKLAKELFSKYPSGRPPEASFPVPESREPSACESYKDVPTGHVQVAYLAPRAGSDDYAAARVLAAILGDGAASRLYSELVGEGDGIAEAAGSLYPLRVEQGSIVLYATAVDVDRALKIINREVERLKTEPVTTEELERARNRLAGRVAALGQRNVEQAARLAWNQLSGLGPGYTDAYLKALKRVDGVDVRQAAARYLVNPVTVVVRPGRPSRTGI
jgi:zinc protease